MSARCAGPFRQVIFDLDGTLLDTIDDLANGANHVCAAHGWPTFPVEAYRRMVGNGMERLVERFIPAQLAGDARAVRRALAELRDYYGAHQEERTRPYPGIVETLDELRAAGVAMAVLTNKDHAIAAPMIARHFGDRFDIVQGRTASLPPKPEPPATRLVLDALGARAASTLYVGDSDVDVCTGHNVGVPVAGASWGFRGRGELEAAGADFIAERPRELLGIALG